MISFKNLKLRPILNSIDSKPCYINIYPHQSIKTKFTIVINQKVLKRYDFVEYLSSSIDKNLTLSVHINKLFLQLAKHIAMLYKIRNYATPHNLKMLYYSLVYSSVNHGIIVKSTANQS